MSQEKSVDDIYRKLKHKDHILQLPDTYIGSIEKHNEFLYTLDESDGKSKIVKKYVEYVPGLLNIFNEILVNSTDHATRLEMMVKNHKKSKSKKQLDIALMTEIRVSIDKQTGEISIYNNGDGIDAEILKEHDMYPVQLIFKLKIPRQ